MTPDRVATWARPDGSIHHIGSTIDRAPKGVAKGVAKRTAGSVPLAAVDSR